MARSKTLHARAGRLGTLFALLVLVGGAGPASGQARGYLLYSQHCVECHTQQIHWRDERLAKDWKGLNYQVRRWQSVASLNWNEEDIQYVTRYLNTRFYDFRPPTELGAVSAGAPPAAQHESAAR